MYCAIVWPSVPADTLHFVEHGLSLLQACGLSSNRIRSVPLPETTRTQANIETRKGQCMSLPGTAAGHELVSGEVADHFDRVGFNTIAMVCFYHHTHWELQDCEAFVDLVIGWMHQRFPAGWRQYPSAGVRTYTQGNPSSPSSNTTGQCAPTSPLVRPPADHPEDRKWSDWNKFGEAWENVHKLRQAPPHVKQCLI